jgi:spore coat protein U-like protein
VAQQGVSGERFCSGFYEQDFQMNMKMNKLALASALVLGGAGFGVNAYAATATATSSATVIAPIAVAKAADLAFGKFSALTGGTIKVDTDSAISVTGAVVKGTGSTGTAAKFDVTGDASNTYSIAHSGTAVLTHTDTTTTMALAKVSALTAASGTTTEVTAGALSGGAQSIYVGGTLTVASGQLAGVYSGTVIVTVEYN